MKHFIFICVLLAISIFMSSCSENKNNAETKKVKKSVKTDSKNDENKDDKKKNNRIIVVETTTEFKNVQYDVWFTYTNYLCNKQANPEKAIYIWNGQEVGQGEKGIAEIKKRIMELPENTRILLFPQNKSAYSISGSLSHPIFDSKSPSFYPFDLFDIESLINKYKLILIYSNFNQEGIYVSGW